MNALPTEQLVARALQAGRSGARAESLRLWREVLAQAPDDPRALNVLGNDALSAGNVAEALRLLQHAAEVKPDVPEIRLNLALVHRARGDSGAELAELDRALALDGYFLPALIAKGAALERLGRKSEAVTVYRGVAAAVPEGAQLLPQLQAGVARARELVAAANAELESFLEERLAPERAAHADARLDRFDDCIDVLVGKKRIFTPQPTFLHFPYLPPLQFHERSDFPELDPLEAKVDLIAGELRRVLAGDDPDLTPYVDIEPWRPVNQWGKLNRSLDWGAFHLWQNGERVEENCARCPETAALLEELAESGIPGRSPNAMFSILRPGSHIPPHTGVSNARLVAHLPLIVPDKCRFRVGSDVREWEYGKFWVFDDTIEHEAWNESDELRAVLIVDVWNPYLTAAERDLLRTTYGAIDEFKRRGG